MKKYITLIFTTLCACIFFAGCDGEDSRVDPTVMPPATNTGANTFGCLIDGWIYSGGRYSTDWFFPVKEPERSIKFIYKEKKEEMEASVYIDEDGNTIDFKILSPEEGKECPLTDFMFIKEALKDGAAHITRFDLKKKIVSGTFGNNDRLTKGRFDTYFEIDPYDYPEHEGNRHVIRTNRIKPALLESASNQ